MAATDWRRWGRFVFLALHYRTPEEKAEYERMCTAPGLWPSAAEPWAVELVPEAREEYLRLCKEGGIEPEAVRAPGDFAPGVAPKTTGG